MEIQKSGTERRIADNVEVLAGVEAEIVLLEEKFAGLESLKSEKDRLAVAVQNLRTEEAQILADGASSESAIVKKLIETRARIDVQNARLVSTQDKIKEQIAALDVQGTNVRRAFQVVVARLYLSRDARVSQTLLELFGGDWIHSRDGKRIEMKYLARQTRSIKEMRDLDNKVSHPISDPVQETAALMRSRTWLSEITSLIENEPNLMLKVLPREHEPIEEPEPVREMVEA